MAHREKRVPPRGVDVLNSWSTTVECALAVVRQTSMRSAYSGGTETAVPVTGFSLMGAGAGRGEDSMSAASVDLQRNFSLEPSGICF